MSSSDARQALDALLWASQTLYAARTDRAGTVRAVNPALAEAAGGDLLGEPLASVVAAPQRPALPAPLAAADEDWRTVAVGFWQGGAAAAEDRLVHVCEVGDDELLV